MKMLMLILWILQPNQVVLDNDYVKVTKNAAPCASAGTPGCGERVVVALSGVELQNSGRIRKMNRGEVAAIRAGQSYEPPLRGEFLEVAFKPNRPQVKTSSVLIPPEKNSLLYDGDKFFVFEEKLRPGETRARHSHSQRVVIVLNETRLQQWPEGAPEVLRTQIPDDVRFNEPVIHVVKNVGDKPLRNIVIELKP